MDLPGLFECLSHPVRFRLLTVLSEGSRCVQELQEVLKLSQVEVSRQLATLRGYGFVEVSVAGTRRYYRLASKPTFEFARQMRCLRECVNHGDLLKEEFERLRALGARNAPAGNPLNRGLAPPRKSTASEPPAETGLGRLEDHLL